MAAPHKSLDAGLPDKAGALGDAGRKSLSSNQGRGWGCEHLGQETAFFSGQIKAEQGQLPPSDRKRRTDSIPYPRPIPAHDSVIVKQGSSCYGAKCLDANLMPTKAYSPPGLTRSLYTFKAPS